MKILVTGSEGQLGSEIRELSPEYAVHDLVFIDINDLDLTDFAATQALLEKTRPDCIINCAAYTAVDKSELEKETAFRLNGELPGLLAGFCKQTNSLLIHLSTDYVFSGTGFKPYSEDDLPAPQGYYAFSKREGEIRIIEKECRSIILRTSWLYSTFGNNFLKTIYNKALVSNELRVVCDQIGTPTYAADLARVIMDLLVEAQVSGTDILHYSNEGAVSWYDFAKTITEIAKINGCKVIPIETKDFPTPAKRPYYSVLNKSKIKDRFGITIPWWKESAEICIEKMKSQNK